MQVNDHGNFSLGFGAFLERQSSRVELYFFHDHAYVEAVSHHILRVLFYVQVVRPLVEDWPFLASHGGISAEEASFMMHDGS